MLADVFALYLKTKNFHWHMSGRHFRDYHLLLDEQGDQLFAMTDPIAERARKIGGTTLRSIGEIARQQRILDNDADYVEPQDMLAELRDDNKQLVSIMREIHAVCDEYGDVATASLLEEMDRRDRTPHLVPVRSHARSGEQRLTGGAGACASANAPMRAASCAAGPGELSDLPDDRPQGRAATIAVHGASDFGAVVMIKFYFHPSPNPAKVALFLEESGLPYEIVPVDTRKGEQHKPEFLAINPNGKTPAIVDADATVFDSNAILMYLAEKTGKFLPPNTPAARGQFLSWMMFVASGIGPYSGQAVHFKHHAPEKNAYAIKRYEFETKRHYAILDAQLAKHRYMLGDTYTIVDMAVWGWARAVPFILGAEAWANYPNVKRLLDEINARPAAARAEALKDKHTYKNELDEDARRHMFPHTVAA